MRKKKTDRGRYSQRGRKKKRQSVLERQKEKQRDTNRYEKWKTGNF